MSFPAIRYFQETAHIIKSRNRLPHWQQEGACYFITFLRDLEHFVNVAWYIKRNPEKAHVPSAPLYMADWLQELLARW